MKHKDFQYTKRTVLADASDVACAEVVHTANRDHWRLVGQRYDVMSWAPDKDKAHYWGRILLRMVPPSDSNRKSAEMSALRILSENPSVVQHPHIPKFQIDSAMSKFKGMFQGKDAVSRVLAELHTFLTKQSIRSMLVFPVSSIESTSPAVMTLRRPKSFFDYHLWVIPKVSDYGRSQFNLDIKNCSAVNIPMAQIQAFASRIIRCISEPKSAAQAKRVRNSAFQSVSIKGCPNSLLRGYNAENYF